MKFHPLANVFPLLEGEQFERLVEDVRKNGLVEPIVVHEGKILDGRNRWRACQKAGVEPRTTNWDGECEHVALFVISKNIHRRHLTASQRGMIVKRHLLPVLEAEAAERKEATQVRGGKPPEPTDPAKLPEPSGKGEAREQAAQAGGVSPRTVSDAKAVDEADPNLGDEVATGGKTLGKAKREIKERDIGLNRVPMPFQNVVREIVHQKGVPKETAATMVDTAMTLDTGEIERLHEKYENGSEWDRSYVKSRLASVQPPPDPRCATLVTIRRELTKLAKSEEDEWAPRLTGIANDVESLRNAITDWRKPHV